MVHARDGQSEWIECGEADETLVVDSLDFGSAFCERARRRGAARAVMSRHASISTHEDYPDYLTIEGVGCPGDFRYPHCNVRFAFSQQGKRIDRSNPVKLGTGDYNMHDVYMIRGTAFDFDRSPSGSGWAGRVLLTLRSEDSRGRSYTLRQAVPFRIRAELFLNVPP